MSAVEIGGAGTWAVIVVLGVLTYAVRFMFLGLIGDRDLPGWVLRHLRYTGVAVLPGLVAPLAVWPEATGDGRRAGPGPSGGGGGWRSAWAHGGATWWSR